MLRSSLIALALALLAGCGDRRLVIDIDVLSFVAQADRGTSFGPILPVPPDGAYLGETALVDAQEVKLLEGIEGITSVQSVTITANIFYRSTAGAGSDTVRLYLSDPATYPQSTPPVFTGAFVFTPGGSDSVQIDVGGDPRVVDLFNSRNFLFSLTTALRGPSSSPSLSGRVEIHSLHCIVISSRKPL